MELRVLIAIGLTVYGCAMLGLSLWLMRRVRKASDFLLAGRGLPFWVLVGTFTATGVGTGVIVGASGPELEGLRLVASISREPLDRSLASLDLRILFTGASFFLPTLPHSPLDATMALPYHLFVISTQVPGMPIQIQYGTVLVLLVFVLGMNLIATVIRSRARARRQW